MNFWMGIEAPAKTPQPVVERLATGLKAMMESKEVRDQMANFGADPFYTTPAEFKRIRDADIQKYGKLVKEMGLKQE
jgi:tripartite-type tricarboxylate transporter receptor subunit TctC